MKGMVKNMGFILKGTAGVVLMLSAGCTQLVPEDTPDDIQEIAVSTTTAENENQSQSQSQSQIVPEPLVIIPPLSPEENNNVQSSVIEASLAPELAVETDPELTAATAKPVIDLIDIFNELDFLDDEVNFIQDEQIATIVDEQNLDDQSLDEQQLSVITLCEEIGDTLGSVSTTDCLEHNLQFAGAYSVNNRPIVIRDFAPVSGEVEKSKILILGGIHGDEYSSISIMFKWMSALNNNNHSEFLWRFAPTVNPDGLLAEKASRQNANGVDLNRNFPSSDWSYLAKKYWQQETGSNVRRYPGDSSSSEPETQWVVEQIATYQPDFIISVHAPYHLLDFDGPTEAPEKIGELLLHQLGVYPGSLGNYAGLDLGLPVITLELPSAGILPDEAQIEMMWTDLLDWLQGQQVDSSS